jgi:hypothetical protein
MAASLLAAGLTVGSSIYGASQANKAAKTQQRAAQEAAQLQQRNYRDFEALNQPAIQGGTQARNALLNAVGLNGAEAQRQYFQNFETDPGFQQSINQGIQAIDRSAAARGGLNSGRTLKSVADYTTGRYLNEAFNNRMNRLTDLSNAGQNAINAQGQLGANTATGMGNNLITAGNAQAQGYANQANAVTSGVNNLNTLIGRSSGKINDFFGTGNSYNPGWNTSVSYS